MGQEWYGHIGEGRRTTRTPSPPLASRLSRALRGSTSAPPLAGRSSRSATRSGTSGVRTPPPGPPPRSTRPAHRASTHPARPGSPGQHDVACRRTLPVLAPSADVSEPGPSQRRPAALCHRNYQRTSAPDTRLLPPSTAKAGSAHGSSGMGRAMAAAATTSSSRFTTGWRRRRATAPAVCAEARISARSRRTGRGRQSAYPAGLRLWKCQESRHMAARSREVDQFQALVTAVGSATRAATSPGRRSVTS